MSSRSGTPRRLGRPPAADSAETEDRIRRAARRCFAFNGYDHTTNREIATAAGITSAAIYHYFGSKLDLFAAVAKDVEDRIVARLESDLAALGPASLEDRLVALVDATVVIMKEDPSIGRFVTALPHEAARSSEISHEVSDRLASIQAIFARVVDDAAARRELAPGVDQEAVTDMVVATFMGLASMPTRAAQYREMADGFARLIRGTLLEV